MGVASKILHALCVQGYNRTPLQEILNPPLLIIYNNTGLLETESRCPSIGGAKYPYYGPTNVMIVYDDDRREALGIWKSRLGSGATYRALIEVFFKAGRLDYADAVCSLLKDSSDARGKINNIV